ncbi:MAG: hypothetical protein V3T53_04475 [Phycisphaerales bacterium]
MTGTAISGARSHTAAELSRRLRCVGCRLLLCVVVVALNGYVTPLVLGADRFGLGLYSVDDREINEDVQYTKIEGVGVLFARGSFRIGYSNAERVVARLEAKSYGTITPLAEIAVGEEANALVRQFVSRELTELEEKETNQ